MPNDKTAIVTTTIRVPLVLRQYRQEFSLSETRFFIAGDKKSPHAEIRAFCQGLEQDLEQATYYSDVDQESLGYLCSKVIGWNTIQRRNIAILEAIKWGADRIITIDDDNIPMPGYSFYMRCNLNETFAVLQVQGKSTRFVNVGDFSQPRFVHRGFPVELRRSSDFEVTGVRNEKIGVMAGLWLGDPDIDAVERIVNAPNVVDFSTILEAGISIASYNFSPFNSQNTLFAREVAPLMMVLPGIGRYDDIWGSYIAQRIMWETQYRVMYGHPFVYQERNPQNLVNNLEKEIYGMRNTMRFCEDLMSLKFKSGTVLGMLQETADYLFLKDYIPEQTRLFLTQWVEDVKGVI